jgi:hypothetical protein
MPKAKKPEMSFGDVMDRLTILTRKIYFGEEEAISEHRHLEKHLEAFGIDGKIITNTIRLAMMNFEIWNLENELRRGGEDKFELEEIGTRALAIRDLNRKRIRYKNNLTAIEGGHRELKINHRSQ